VPSESSVLTLRLALRAIRWRAGASATVFVVAVVAIFAATVGPIYLPAVDDTVLVRHLTDATSLQRDVLVSRQSVIGYPGVNWNSQVQALANQVASNHLYGRPVPEQQLTVTYGGPEPLKSELVSIRGLCGHLRIVSGHCLSKNSTTDTLISANTAKAEHLAVGGMLDTTSLASTTTSAFTSKLRVVGIYRPIAPNGAFWEPWYLFQFGQAASPNQLPPGDAAFVTSTALSSRLQDVSETLQANVPLQPRRVRYSQIGALRSQITRLHASVARLIYAAGSTGVPVASVTTGLPGVLDETQKETSLARTLVTVATAQLALLAIFLLYAAVANSTIAQGPEVALAKLRGRRPGSVLLQCIAQPVALILAAGPVAAVLAWVVVGLLAPGIVGHSVDVVFPTAAYGVAALGVVGGVLAAIVAARRIVVTPVGELMRLGAAKPGSAVGLLVADAAAVTIAVAGLIELEASGVLNSGKPNPLSVLAPTLLAVAAAVVVLRLLPLLARSLARWTRDSQRLATFLVVRQLLRRPAEARAMLLVAVAVSIATFAVVTWSDSGHNRSLRALNQAGANTVLYVRPGSGVDDLRQAVDRADPNGQSMAVAYTTYGLLPPLIAVDTARFQSVAAWVPGNSSVPLPALLHRLADRDPPVVVSGSLMRLDINLTKHPRQAVHLAVLFALPDHSRATRTVAPIAPGRRSYEISLPPSCVRGCHVTGLDLTSPTPQSFGEIALAIGASIRSGGRWQPVRAFSAPGRWRGDGKGPLKIRAAGGTLSLDVEEFYGWWPATVSAAIPVRVPAVVGSALAADETGNQIDNIEVAGLDGQANFVDGVMRSVTLPQVDRGGVMVDLGSAMAVMNHRMAERTQYEVWLSAKAPTDMVARLARQHVYVQRTVHAATYHSSLDQSGPAFADSLFLLSALAATVLAIGATAIGRVLSIRRRGYELAALEAVGIAPRTLRRATIAEQGSVFGIGLIVGLGAGLIGSWLALPSTPVFVNTATGPPLVLGLPWALVAALTGGMVLVFALVSVGIARMVERTATPGQLRGAQQ
jgi:hypothetical protein